MAIRGVIFDCDGVLINSEALLAEVMADMLAELGLDYEFSDGRSPFTGLERSQTEAKIGSDYQRLSGEELPADFWDNLSDAYHEALRERLAAIDGIGEVLTMLRQAGIPVAVGSNSQQQNLEAKLKQVGLYDLFYPHIYSADLAGAPKPAPDVYEFAAAQLGFDPAECAIIDDSVPGIKAGAAAGAFVIGFTGEKNASAALHASLRESGAHTTVDTMWGVKMWLAHLITGPQPPQNDNRHKPFQP